MSNEVEKEAFEKRQKQKSETSARKKSRVNDVLRRFYAGESYKEISFSYPEVKYQTLVGQCADARKNALRWDRDGKKSRGEIAEYYEVPLEAVEQMIAQAEQTEIGSNARAQEWADHIEDSYERWLAREKNEMVQHWSIGVRLNRLLSNENALKWLLTPHPHLNGKSPVEVMSQGEDYLIHQMIDTWEAAANPQ